MIVTGVGASASLGVNVGPALMEVAELIMAFWGRCRDGRCRLRCRPRLTAQGWPGREGGAATLQKTRDRFLNLHKGPG